MKPVLTAVATATSAASAGARVQAEEPKNKKFAFVLPTVVQGDPATLQQLKKTVQERATLRELEVSFSSGSPNQLSFEIKGHAEQLRMIRELTESLTSAAPKAKFDFAWEKMQSRTETYQAFQISGAAIGWQQASRSAQAIAVEMGFQVDAVRVGRSDKVRIEGIIPPGKQIEFLGRLQDAFEG